MKAILNECHYLRFMIRWRLNFNHRENEYMTKADLIAAIAEKTGLTKVEADKMFVAIFDTMTEVLAKQDKIAIPGFGNFATKVREERKGRNPSSGQEMVIPRAVVVNFKPATQLKEALNGSKEK